MIFELLNYYQGKLVLAAIIGLVICCVQSSSANQLINQINEENSSDYRKQSYPTAPFKTLIFLIVILVIALVVPLK